MPQKPMAAVKALIEDDGRYLLIKQDVGDREIWNLPGGRVDFGETPLEALERELQEEVSLSPEIGETLGMYTFFIDDEHQVVLTVFEATYTGGEIDIDSNPADDVILDHRWVEPGEVLELELGEGVERFFQRYLN
ncbi:MAG: NUDIX hydrolase [Candidatus Nanosalina sp.]